jgi:hypothetical protein
MCKTTNKGIANLAIQVDNCFFRETKELKGGTNPKT